MFYNTPKELFIGICDAIRSKDGTTEEINHQDIPSRIEAIEVGVDTSSATATANDLRNGKTAYVNGEKITGRLSTINPDSLYGSDTVYMRDDDGYICYTYNPTGEFIVGGDYPLTIGKAGYEFGNVETSYVAKGKTFTSVDGFAIEGTGKNALTVKTGTTTSNTIDTGLSDVKYFTMCLVDMTDTSTTGVIDLIYDSSVLVSGTNENTVRINVNTTAGSTTDLSYTFSLAFVYIQISNGEITLKGPGQYKRLIGTYKWIAVGHE